MKPPDERADEVLLEILGWDYHDQLLMAQRLTYAVMKATGTQLLDAELSQTAYYMIAGRDRGAHALRELVAAHGQRLNSVPGQGSGPTPLHPRDA